MFRLIKWVFSTVLAVIFTTLHVVADVLLFCLKWVFIAAVFGLAALMVVQYAYELHYGESRTHEYEYQAFIEAKVGVLQGETKAVLVRFDVVDLDSATFIQTRAFLTPEQVLELEELPTLTFTKTAPGSYRIEELQVTTKRF